MSSVAPSQIKVAVGLSGGVDSAVSALLLKQAGYQVTGLFMKNWEEQDDQGVCTSEQDFKDVQRVCDHLDIPYYSFEFVKEYRDQVFARFLEEYQKGYTPNPDILCNREIKFNVFLKQAKGLGADYLATGHYCRKTEDSVHPRLLKGTDPNKDQSYFVYTLTESILKQILFPVGGLLKSQVRELAREARLPVAEKKDSTGICFIGERNFRKFLHQYIEYTPGEFRHLESGEAVGKHLGVAYYTLGQRRGLGLGGEGESWYVVAKDRAQNIVWVSRGDPHPALYADWLECEEVSWVAERAPELPMRLRAKSRYRQKDQGCELIAGSEPGTFRVIFDEPQRALTPGQSVVFYSGEECLGGAVIRKVGPSYYEQKRILPLKLEELERTELHSDQS